MRNRRFAFGTGVFLLLVALGAGHTSSSDEETVFRTAEAFLEGRLDIPPAPDRGLNVAPGRNGKTYPYYPPGGALLVLPAATAAKALDAALPLGPYGRRAFVLLTLPPFLLAAFSVFLLRRGARPSAVLCFVFASFLLPYARTLHPLLPLALLLAFAWVRRDELSPLALGALFGTSLLLRFDAWIWWLGLLLVRRWNLAAAVRFALGATPFVLFLLLYNHLRFGNPFETGYSNLEGGFSAGFATPLRTGLYGLTLSPSRSLLLFAPLSVFGGYRLFRGGDRRARVVLLLTWLPPLLWYSKLTVWHGGPGWGPRYLLPGLTVATLGILYPRALDGLAPRVVVVFALAVNLLAVSAPADTHFDRVFESGATVDEAYLAWKHCPIVGQLRTLARLRWDRPEMPGGWAPGGGGHPWNQNLRYTVDVWPFYAWKLLGRTFPFLLWAGAGIAGLLLVMTSAAGYRVGHGGADGHSGAHIVRGKRASPLR